MCRQIKEEAVALNCTWGQKDKLTHTCSNGEVVSVQCTGQAAVYRYTCTAQNTTTCGVWTGSAWDDTYCTVTSIGTYETSCR